MEQCKIKYVLDPKTLLGLHMSLFCASRIPNLESILHLPIHQLIHDQLHRCLVVSQVVAAQIGVRDVQEFGHLVRSQALQFAPHRRLELECAGQAAENAVHRLAQSAALCSHAVLKVCLWQRLDRRWERQQSGSGGGCEERFRSGYSF